jgi:hypothetical protein
MPARVPRQDGLQSARRLLRPCVVVRGEAVQRLPHGLGRIHRDVVAGAKEVLRVQPRRADQRNAARQRLEHADGRNSPQHLHVGAPRHVQRHAAAREGGGHVDGRGPAAKLHAGVRQLRQRVLGIADAVRRERQLGKAPRGAQPVVAQLLRALLVAPVADPDDVGGFRQIQRPEPLHVRGLVERPRPPHAEAIAVHVAQHVAERQHAVVRPQVEAGDGFGVAPRAVVRVVKERDAARRAHQRRKRVHHVRIVPLVHQHHVRTRHRLRQVLAQRRRHGVVAADVDLGIRAGKVDDGGHAVIAQQVLHGPGAARLVAHHAVPHARERAHQPADEVRVAMVPVADRAVDEEDELHRAPRGRANSRGE